MEPMSFGGMLFAALTLTVASVDSVPLYDDLGDHHHEITTSSPLAQRYFDQGFRLSYAFNHAEAIASFRQATRIDPACAMCWWGIAYAYGPNINAPMEAEAGMEAYDAIQEALARAPRASERERAYIRAMAVRYAMPPPAERAALDSVYARAMAEVAGAWPDDDDAVVLAADARMNLSPWDYWTREGEPREGTDEILALLTTVLARNPDHPGACHFWIHAVEAARPEEAIACAERLAGLMPGAGHIVHMPAHIYVRVGRYVDAVESNEHAIHVDERFIADRRPEGIYPAGYYPHNWHFLAFAASMAGMSSRAIEAARSVMDKIPLEMAAEVYFLEGIPAYPVLMLARFGRWEEAIAEPMPEGAPRTARALAAYARGVAQAAIGDRMGAEASLAEVRRLAAEALEAAPEAPTTPVLAIASHALEGEIALREGRTDEGVEELRRAAAVEDELLYEEPPLWPFPVRHALGAALLQAGRPGEAETVYREDLARFPENGWSLIGLVRSLEAQGREGEAREARERLVRAWARADVEIAASSF